MLNSAQFGLHPLGMEFLQFPIQLLNQHAPRKIWFPEGMKEGTILYQLSIAYPTTLSQALQIPNPLLTCQEIQHCRLQT